MHSLMWFFICNAASLTISKWHNVYFLHFLPHVKLEKKKTVNQVVTTSETTSCFITPNWMQQQVVFLTCTDESRSSLQGALEGTIREWVRMSIYRLSTSLAISSCLLTRSQFLFVIPEPFTSFQTLLLFQRRRFSCYITVSENNSNFPLRQICIQLSWTVDK